ncbi:39S ribosomal protein L20, mitochondrial-like [Pollicipes pollicipes]|uniref:39S ribosomal protein L20, mitochondrial-like n=1 Tax=Pollicipes pollicipes TaxID=41117 RepID=UPI0018853D47|nr:39S ribosomal protein L20, mitochondrial-like [Pollicipes pollicipes]
MVFLTAATWIRAAKPDKFWRRRRTFRLSAHYYGRARNCYKVAIIKVEKALQYATKGRRQKKKDMTEMWEHRLTAGCREHGASLPVLREGLMRCNILLNRKVLSDLAIWEPRTFKSIVDLCKAKVAEDRPRGLADIPDRPDHVITRGML